MFMMFTITPSQHWKQLNEMFNNLIRNERIAYLTGAFETTLKKAALNHKSDEYLRFKIA